MKTKETKPPVFKSESDEANWWASAKGRTFVNEKRVLIAYTFKMLLNLHRSASLLTISFSNSIDCSCSGCCFSARVMYSFAKPNRPRF